jgi:hypothetical protein
MRRERKEVERRRNTDQVMERKRRGRRNMIMGRKGGGRNMIT